MLSITVGAYFLFTSCHSTEGKYIFMALTSVNDFQCKEAFGSSAVVKMLSHRYIYG